MTVVSMEPWVTVNELAAHFGVSRRWLYDRLDDGMPSAKIARGRRFKISKVEPWLRRGGWLEELG